MRCSSCFRIGVHVSHRRPARYARRDLENALDDESSMRLSGRFGRLVRAIAPATMITTEELGRAMIRVAREGAPKRVLENRDLIELARV